MAVEVPLDIRNWRGLNIYQSPGSIDDTELVEATNFDIGITGELIKRSGFELLESGLGANQVHMLAFLKTDVLHRLVARVGTTLYYSDDGETWAAIAGGPHGNALHAVQYTDNLYIARDDGIIWEYDGTTLTAITNSPVGSFVITFKDRLFVINSFAVTDNSRLWFSEVGDFSSTGWPSTNFIDVNPGDGDFLVGAAIINDVLVLFKTRSSWALYVQGAPENWVLRKTSDQIGCISKDSIKEIEGFLYFAGPRGVYRSDGTNINLISLPIDPAFRGFVITAISANKASAAFYDNKYILYLPIYTSSTQPTWGAWSATTWSQHEQQTWDQTVAQSGDNIFVYHVRVGGWSRWEPASGITPRTFVDVRTDDPVRGLYSGDSAFTGKVFRFGQGVFQDDGVNYACAFETKDFDFAQLTRYKRGKWIGIDCEGLGSVTYNSIADSETQANLPVAQIARRATYKIAGPGYFRTWRFRGSHIGEGPFTLYGLRIHMAIKRTIIGSAT